MFDSSVSTMMCDSVSIGCELQRGMSLNVAKETLESVTRKGRFLTIITRDYEVTVHCRGECNELCKGS